MNLAAIYQIYLKHPVVCTDTRKLTPSCLFFALKGDNFNGNLFASKAIEGGAAYVIVDESEYAVGENYILVQNVLETLQELARHHRQQLNIPVIAIVGSNGKTTTKELLSAVLQTKFKVLSTPGNFNNHIGLPLTLLQLEKTDEIAVIEMGANHEKENALLCEIACPSHGIVTNNGKDHLEGFGSLEGVIRSNAELYNYLKEHKGTAFVNGNDETLMIHSSAIEYRIIYKQADSTKLEYNLAQLKPEKLQPKIVFTYEGMEVCSPLSGDYNFDNILAAVSIGRHFGLNQQEIKQGIESYEPKNLRSQLIAKGTNTIFLDAYNANPSSMEVSIRNFAAMPGENKIVVLGDMFELGPYEAEEHQNLIQYCEGFHFHQIILVGKAFFLANKNHTAFETTAQAAAYLQSQSIEHSYIFLKGSRGMKIESLIDSIH
jgi:UDP-N-acetylmuramoyl-tripeptide--D-alanyl-D-alanine ligase